VEDYFVLHLAVAPGAVTQVVLWSKQRDAARTDSRPKMQGPGVGSDDDVTVAHDASEAQKAKFGSVGRSAARRQRQCWRGELFFARAKPDDYADAAGGQAPREFGKSIAGPALERRER
jgi:hypothetical protein